MPSLVGVEITTQLSIYSRDSNFVKSAVDADSIPTAAVEKDNVDWLETTDTTVTADDTGVYSFAWTPDEAGTYEVQWVWEYGSVEYSKTERYTVESTIIGVSEETSDTDTELAEPDLGVSKACKITGTFYDASGNFMQGVHVRFTPLRLMDAVLTSGVIAQEVTAVSDENGLVQLYLVRGVKGMLAITGIGLVREVLVPEVGAIDLMDLAALGDDLLEVQRPQFTELPRRSS
jgi:hypothetical protein